MCRTYNMIGSLATLKMHLEDHNIKDFNSLRDVVDFQSNYNLIRQQVITEHEYLIEQEKEILKTELQQLDTTIEIQKKEAEQRLIYETDKLKEQFNFSTDIRPSNIFQKITKSFKLLNYKKQLIFLERKIEIEVFNPINKLNNIHQDKSNRYQFITSQFNLAVEQSSRKSLLEIEKKKKVIDKLNNYIYGALGEHKVVKTLEALPDEYYLINDFSVSFYPAIYNKKDNDYIKTIQIDHILVAPSGVFLIETKNWSSKSLDNLSLRSPIEQIKRSSYVLYRMLNNEIKNIHLQLEKHHWGDKKITIRNLIVMTNTKPKEEFQYVKVLTLNELLSYIKYFKPIYSNTETQLIAEFLLRINDKNEIYTK